MARRYYYYVTINNCNSCEFNSLKEAKEYVESMRNEDGSYSYSVTNSKGETFTMKAEIELKKRWEYVDK